jgi:hypothetical protein
MALECPILQYIERIGESNVYKANVPVSDPKKLDKAITEIAEQGLEVSSIFCYPQTLKAGAGHICNIMYFMTKSA